jgi:predicted DNA-binding transcriptional regulator YafY
VANPVERLTNLLALLLETSAPLSLHQITSELAGMYPDGASASRGQFERDKKLLREIGVPIETEVAVGGDEAGQTRYWIDRDRYELADLDLDDDERRAVQLAVAATRSGSAPAQAALWKLGAGIAGSATMAAASVPNPPQLTSTLAVLREAIAARSVVEFDYRSVSRVLEPLGLLLRNGFWYLVAIDGEHGERRTFRVDRIQGDLSVGDAGAFERPRVDLGEAFPADPKLIAISESDTASVMTAVVRIDEPQAGLLEQHLGSSVVHRRLEDGSIEFAIEYRNPEAMRAWVLGFGPDAEVVGPDELRAEVVSWLESMAATP